ncbi:hypothetical protein GCM10025857_26000 [Alicyclobacillus contaminans]|nr:hypothetical protein GCM10025857_26000 [Alicyclobacillus contaminans]
MLLSMPPNSMPDPNENRWLPKLPNPLRAVLENELVLPLYCERYPLTREDGARNPDEYDRAYTTCVAAFVCCVATVVDDEAAVVGAASAAAGVSQRINAVIMANSFFMVHSLQWFFRNSSYFSSPIHTLRAVQRPGEWEAVRIFRSAVISISAYAARHRAGASH